MASLGAETLMLSRQPRRVARGADQTKDTQTEHLQTKHTSTSSGQSIIRIDDAATDEKRKLFESALEATGNAELRKLRVLVTDGEVTLHGEVSSFYHKQVAQEAIRPLAIGVQIVNKLIVS